MVSFYLHDQHTEQNNDETKEENIIVVHKKLANIFAIVQ